MLEFALFAIGSVLFGPIAIVLLTAYIGLSIACAWMTVAYVTFIYGRAIFKAFWWRIIDTIIDWIPFLPTKQRRSSHHFVNDIFGYNQPRTPRNSPCRLADDPGCAHIPEGMTSQEYLHRVASGQSVPNHGLDDMEEHWINDPEETEALWMAHNSPIQRPSFHDVPIPIWGSKSASAAASRSSSRASTSRPFNSTSTVDTIRPRSRSGSFVSNPMTPLRTVPTTPMAEHQYFPLQPTNSSSSLLQGRRPSLPSDFHRRNNLSTTSFGSVREEL